MNKIQNNYRYAKATLEMFENQERKFEIDFMSKKNIVNDDGTTATKVYMIDDEELFDKVNLEYEAAVTGCGLWEKLIKAKEELKKAENELLKFALDIIPDAMKDTKETLKEAVKTNFKVREQVIENALKLDTKTL